MESPFQTVSRIISEPSNGFDDLRIIATSGTKLDKPTRALIAAAADELEQTQRMLVSTQAALIEAQAQLMALKDRLLTIRQCGNYQHVEVTYAKGK